MQNRTPHDILGISKKATAKEIKKAYHEKARKYHPDRYPNDPRGAALAIEEMKCVNWAYELLTDPDEYKKYKETKNSPSFHTSYASTPTPSNLAKLRQKIATLSSVMKTTEDMVRYLNGMHAPDAFSFEKRMDFIDKLEKLNRFLENHEELASRTHLDQAILRFVDTLLIHPRDEKKCEEALLAFADDFTRLCDLHQQLEIFYPNVSTLINTVSEYNLYTRNLTAIDEEIARLKNLQNVLIEPSLNTLFSALQYLKKLVMEDVNIQISAKYDKQTILTSYSLTEANKAINLIKSLKFTPDSMETDLQNIENFATDYQQEIDQRPKYINFAKAAITITLSSILATLGCALGTILGTFHLPIGGTLIGFVVGLTWGGELGYETGKEWTNIKSQESVARHLFFLPPKLPQAATNLAQKAKAVVKHKEPKPRLLKADDYLAFKM